MLEAGGYKNVKTYAIGETRGIRYSRNGNSAHGEEIRRHQY